MVGHSFHCNHIEFFIHTITGNHCFSKFCGLFNIVGSTGCNLMEDQFFGSSSTGKCCNFIFQLFLCHEEMLSVFNLHRISKGTGSSWNNGDFVYRSRFCLFRGDKCVTDLMIRYNEFFFIGENSVFLLISGNNNFYTFFHICLRDELTIVTDSTKGSFIYNISKFSTGGAGSSFGNSSIIDVISNTNFLGMYF